MQTLIALKFVLGSIEESIKSILVVKKDFDEDLFRNILKKNVYEILSDEDYSIGVEQILKKACIGYDLSNDNVDEENKDEDVEDFEITIDIPLGKIIEGVQRMIERGEVENIYTERDLNRDMSLIASIWEEWIPSDEFCKESKGMVDYLLDNIS